MIYIREDMMKTWRFDELNFRESDSASPAEIYYFGNLEKAFGTYSSYKKRLLIGNFNTDTTEPCISCFVYEHELHNPVNQKTCFKGPQP